MKYALISLTLFVTFGLWLTWERIQYNRAQLIYEKNIEMIASYESDKTALKKKYEGLLSDSRVKADLGLYGTVQHEFMIKDLELDLLKDEKSRFYEAALNSIQKYNVIFRIR